MAHVTPTIPPPEPDSLSSSLKRNIQALEDRRRQQAAAAMWEERIAEAITRFTGSMRFVYLHVVLFGAWFLVNLGVVPGVPRFDPSFVVLAMVASVELGFKSMKTAYATIKGFEVRRRHCILIEPGVTGEVRFVISTAREWRPESSRRHSTCFASWLRGSESRWQRS